MNAIYGKTATQELAEMGVITFGNNAQNIVETNYFDHELAQRGFFYLCWNAGAARLLVPDNQKDIVEEIKTGKYAVLSRGKWMAQGGVSAIEVLFEDNTNSPLAITIAAEQSFIPHLMPVSGFSLTVWTRDGEVLRLPCKYRAVSQIPCLKKWGGK